MNKIIFLEGPAFSGKTTFLQQAKGDVIRVPEASEFLGGDSHFPDAPTDAKTMAYCSYFFAVMENKRLEKIRNANGDNVVLIDRFTPLSSMIFYALRHANGDIETSEYERGLRLSAAIFSQTVTLPVGECKFIRFDLSSPQILSQRLTRGTRNTELADWTACEFYSDRYRAILPPSTVCAMDGVYVGDLLGGEWSDLSRTMETMIPTVDVSSEELDLYLPEPIRQKIEASIDKLLLKGDIT